MGFDCTQKDSYLSSITYFGLITSAIAIEKMSKVIKMRLHSTSVAYYYPFAKVVFITNSEPYIGSTKSL